MTRSAIFWILMLLWLIFGIWTAWPSYYLVGGNVMLFFLIGLLGWQVYGAAIKGG